MRDSLLHPSARTGFWLLIGLLGLFAAGKAVLFDTIDPDCFWHLRVAAQLHRDGIGPIVDDLSFASNKQPWTPYSWLAELGMKAVWDTGGYRLAVAVAACMQAGIVVLLAMCCVEMQMSSTACRHTQSFFNSRGRKPRCSSGDTRVPTTQDRAFRPRLSKIDQPDDPSWLSREPLREHRYLAAAVAVAIGTFLILPYLSFRPVTMAFVLLFAMAWLILRDQRNLPSASVWLIVPLTVLLTNIHLFSFFVPAICFAIAIGAMLEHDARRFRRYSQLATATALACMATPMLPGLIHTIFYYSASDKMVAGPVIAEMQSFARGPMGWVTATGVIGMLICIAWRHRAVHIGQLICVVAATLLMLKLGRFVPLFAVAACPALALTLPGLKDRLLAKPVVIIALTCVLTLGIGRVALSFPRRSVTLAAWVNRHGKDTPGYPCDAANFVDRSVNHSSGHLINEFSWGGYLAWRLADKYQVLLDGRTQVYPQSLWHATYLGTDTDRQKFLSQVTADAALIPAEKSAFRVTLVQLGWRTVYKDDRAEVLVPPAPGVARIE